MQIESFDKKGYITVLAPCIDAIKEKNLYQFKGLGNYGYRFIILTSDSTGYSRGVIGSIDWIKLYICPLRWKRLWYIFKLIKILLLTHIDVVEIYPDHPLELILTALVKLARIPIIIIARGAEYEYVENRMSKVRRLAFRLTYAFADCVIYKELYMKDMLLKMRKKNIYMLSNAVNVPSLINQHRCEKCHFLFLNTIKIFRHPEVVLRAFLNICQTLNLTFSSNIRLSIVGLKGKGVSGEEAQKELTLLELINGRDVPVKLYPWTNQPAQFLDNADVFLLPADVVFLNYSLLEAMARGIPSIVQESQGSELIVTHGVDGYILPLDEKGWEDYMLKMINDPILRKTLGLAAREKVERQFSLEAYLRKYDGIYREILKNRNSARRYGVL